ncbi:heme exporter protein CcmB [Salaquimonas pukyongi]|uniref:heme exporter protein CcmB n=1 Tax=Salaquimonas pukyongi TaxID=2712698 RepID=UPI00096B9BAA|nr:heme exporter protein CcmB [Salaquimonas pukyongi]
MTALLVREVRGALRAGGGALMGVLFFLAVVTVFPFAIGPDLNQLGRIGPAILWIGALLASLLGLDRLFAMEREDGSLDILVMQPHPLMVTVLVKCLAHWIVSGLPLILATPLFGVMLNVSPLGIAAVMATLAAGTPAITFIGAASAAVASALPRGGLLIAILTLPLVIPVLIFGITATNGALYDPDPFTAPFLILLALTLFSGVLGPLAASFMLRHSAE